MRGKLRLAFCFLSVLLSLALSVLTGFAQVPGDPGFDPEMKSLVAHTSWTIRDGAPGNITALAQTSDGYLWLGTPLGLYRFNGFDFLSYPTTSLEVALPSVDIEALSADAVGGLWIGYHVGGISYLSDDGHLTSYTQRNGLGQIRHRNSWLEAMGRYGHLEITDCSFFAGDDGRTSGPLTVCPPTRCSRYSSIRRETSGLRPVKRYLFYAMVRRSSAFIRLTAS